MIMLNVSKGKICFVNTKMVWFEYYPAGHELRTVVPLAFFSRKKELRKTKEGLSIDLKKTSFSRFEMKILTYLYVD